MSEAIKPALTADEWAADSIQRTDVRGNVLVIVRDKEPSTEDAGGHHHALAAIALHGKPFGFTYADAEFVRSAAGVLENVLSHDSEHVAALRSLAARIAALLPHE